MIPTIINLVINFGILAIVYYIGKVIITRAPFIPEPIKGIVLWVWLAVCGLIAILWLLNMTGTGYGYAPPLHIMR